MANEIKFSWVGGQTSILADVFKPDGTNREVNISLAENDTGRLYLGSCATIEPGDTIIIHQGGIYLSSQGYENRTGYKLASDGLDSVSTTEPSGVASNFREMIVQVWRRFYKKTTATKSQIKTYKDDNSVAATQTATFDGTTKTVGNAS